MKFWIGFMFSFAALAVIVVQSAIYVKQTEFMKQQIEATAIAERAYLAFTGMNVTSPIANNTIVINAVLTNGGRTRRARLTGGFRPPWSRRRQSPLTGTRKSLSPARAA